MILRGMKGFITAKLVPDPSNGDLPQYESNLDCLWSILGKKDHTILLRFAMLDIESECGYDYLCVSVLSTPFIHQLLNTIWEFTQMIYTNPNCQRNKVLCCNFLM